MRFLCHPLKTLTEHLEVPEWGSEVPRWLRGQPAARAGSGSSSLQARAWHAEDKAQRNPCQLHQPGHHLWRPGLPRPRFLGTDSHIPFAQPFSWRSFYQLSCKHRGRSSRLRAFGIETVFRPCSRGSGLSNDNNTSKKETRVSWNNAFGNLNFSPDSVTLASQLIHSRDPPRSWEHIIFLNLLTNGLPETRAPLTGTPQGRARGSGEARRELRPIASALQLPWLASAELHDVLRDWNPFFFFLKLVCK